MFLWHGCTSVFVGGIYFVRVVVTTHPFSSHMKFAIELSQSWLLMPLALQGQTKNPKQIVNLITLVTSITKIGDEH
jgi:hypothetical protein